jgi:hypothetical protein
MVRATFSGAPLPEKVTDHLTRWLRESIRGVVKEGNRQLRASKKALGRPEAKGVLLIANDNNYGFGPMAMLRVIGDAAARLPDNHVDATVYFTPNVFHRAPDSDVAWNVWSPQYRDQTDEKLSEFINELGRAWGAFVELTTGQPHVERREMPNVNEAHEHVSSMHPVRRLGRQE